MKSWYKDTIAFLLMERCTRSKTPADRLGRRKTRNSKLRKHEHTRRNTKSNTQIRPLRQLRKRSKMEHPHNDTPRHNNQLTGINTAHKNSLSLLIRHAASTGNTATSLIIITGICTVTTPRVTRSTAILSCLAA